MLNWTWAVLIYLILSYLGALSCRNLYPNFVLPYRVHFHLIFRQYKHIYDNKPVNLLEIMITEEMGDEKIDILRDIGRKNELHDPTPRAQQCRRLIHP
jgi:hypothetical protein